MRDPSELIRLAEAMHSPRERYLKWKQVVNRYERGKHSTLATIFMAIGTEGAVEARKQEAYSNQAYKDYLDEWDKAEKEMVKAQVEYENLQTNFDAFQSALSYDREHMKRLGG